MYCIVVSIAHIFSHIDSYCDQLTILSELIQEYFGLIGYH